MIWHYCLFVVMNWACPLFPFFLFFLPDVTVLLSCPSRVPFSCFPSSSPGTAPFRSCLLGFQDSLTHLGQTFTLKLSLCAMYSARAKGSNACPLVSTHQRSFSLVIFAAAMSGWVCSWKPFWVPFGDSHNKAYIEEWLYVTDEMILWAEDNGVPDRVPLPLPGPRPPHQLASPKTLTNVVHPLPSLVELRRLALPFSAEDILSSYEPDVIVRNDSFTL